MIEDKDLYIQKLEKKIKKLKKKNKRLSEDLSSCILADMEEIKKTQEKSSRLGKLKEAYNFFRVNEFERLSKLEEEIEEDRILRIKLPEIEFDEEKNILRMKDMIEEIKLTNPNFFDSEGEENGNQ